MLTIIIPVYNEKKTLAQVLAQVKSLPMEKEIIIVDDYSTDGTRELLANFKSDQVKVLYHDQNSGKGAAIRTALSVVTGDVIVIQDADLEYNPAEIPKLVAIIERDEADVVYGSRFLGSHEKKYFNILYLGNRFFSWLTAVVFGQKVTDMETCYKAFKSSVIKSFTLKSNRFDFEPEVTAKVLKGGFRYKEVPIDYKSRSYQEGKKINWRDGVVAILTILKYRFWD